MNNNFTIHDIDIDDLFAYIGDELKFTLKNFSRFYAHNPKCINVLNAHYGVRRDDKKELQRTIAWDIEIKDAFNAYTKLYRVLATIEKGIEIRDVKTNVAMESKKLNAMLKKFIDEKKSLAVSDVEPSLV